MSTFEHFKNILYIICSLYSIYYQMWKKMTKNSQPTLSGHSRFTAIAETK